MESVMVFSSLIEVTEASTIVTVKSLLHIKVNQEAWSAATGQYDGIIIIKHKLTNAFTVASKTTIRMGSPAAEQITGAACSSQ